MTLDTKHRKKMMLFCGFHDAVVGPKFLLSRKAQLERVTMKEHLMKKLLSLVHVPNSQ